MSTIGHHVYSVITNLESFDDLRHQCLKIAECDVQAVNGHVSIAKAALALGMSDAHLSAMLELVKLFASADAQSYLLHEHQKVHVFGICTTLFIQFFGRHLFDASSQDTWPSFNGGLNEAPVEQVELSKTTPSRSRPSKSGSGPTKAHRIYLKHVIREYRAQEKRLAAHLLKFALPFLEVLRDVREEMNISAEMLPCFSLLLESFNGSPFRASEEAPGTEINTAEQCLQVLEPQLQTAHTAAQLAYAGTSNGGSEDTSRELEHSPSDTSLDCESPRPPPHGAGAGLGRAWTPEDVVGSCRTTVLRGESDGAKNLKEVVKQSFACVYCLGIQSCGVVHSSFMHAGDNRFIQLAPFNTAYEALPAHLKVAGITRVPFHWGNPLEFTREPNVVMPRTGASARGATCPVYLMPPEDFLPFMVPFKGGAGPLCGGACTDSFQWSVDSDPDPSKPCVSVHPDVFTLPPDYHTALQKKIQQVARMRLAVKASFLDPDGKQEVQAVIQAYFKDWLKSSNNIRQVYDLARLERDHARSVSKHRHRDGERRRSKGERSERTDRSAATSSGMGDGNSGTHKPTPS